jgi:16S rRNA (cytidine1402-2'-O)-methyltransferase
MPGTLYVVATPIGNLEDITYRAVRILKEVAAVACEDTRHTRKLLDHYQIRTPALSFHEHNERARAEDLVSRLRAGDSIALVSDAGTPLISDPGFHLVELAAAAGIPVTPIPGPCAAIAALSASALPTDKFTFLGFLPAKSGQRRRVLEAQTPEDTTIYYEAPHRIAEALEDIEAILGPETPIVVAREVTKLHEEFLRGTVASVRMQIAARDPLKGEITLLIGKPAAKPDRQIDLATIKIELQALLDAGIPRMDAIKQIAKSHRLGKREVYRLIFSPSS